MRARLPGLLILGAALAACWALPAGAGAQEPLLRMTGVQVSGGEASWHAEPFFRLDWTQEPGPPAKAKAVVYRLYDPQGNPIGAAVSNSEVVHAIARIEIPPSPGIYKVEAWLENLEGQPGPPVTAALRFDDVPPSPATPQPAPGWAMGNRPVVLAIGHPPGPYPLSGVKGYAVSVDRGSGISPCAAADRCSPEETDLSGGIDDDSISLGILPEGLSVVRVAAVSGSGVASRIESADVRVDATVPEVALENPPSGWSSRPLRVTAVARDRLSGMTSQGTGDPFTAIAVDGGAPTTAAGDRVSAWVGGSGIHDLAFYGRDAAGNVGDGQAGAPAPRHALVMIDEEPPEVWFAAAQDPAEPERIEARVADPLSGPDSRLGSIGLRPSGSRVQFEELPTSVEADRLVADWDSDAYPPGAYEFRAIGYDAAGNAASGTRRSDRARMVLTNPLKTPLELSSGLGAEPRSWRPRKQVPYGRGVRYGGRLRTIWGAPVGGADVAVTETFAPGSKPASRTSVARTRADGSFSLRLAPGPSREVSASFAGTRLLTRAAGAPARLGVRSSVRLRVSGPQARVGGAPVVFSGGVGRAGTRMPRGRSVELQFRYPGAGWSEFRTVRTGAAGRFRYAYRFSDDDSRGVRFQFRALVPAQEGWPYDAGASRPVTITGR